MKQDHYLMALWTLGLLGAAVAIIVYQHAQHAAIIISKISTIPASAPPSSTISANPLNSGAASRASGQWTPTGPIAGLSVFAYNPPQTFQ